MKLNASHRSAFVDAVIKDLPRVDYVEKIRKLVYEDSIEQLPPELHSVARDSVKSAHLNIQMHYFYINGQGRGIQVFGPNRYGFSVSEKAKPQYEALIEQAEEQYRREEELRTRLWAVIKSCQTLKIALERLPEFKKYLPDAQERTSNLPAITNILQDLQALGWPVGKEQAA